MSDKFTAIALRGAGDGGWAEWGDKTVPEMIAIFREYHKHRLEVAQRILAAADDEFYIHSYVGMHVQRNRKVLQEGRSQS